MYIYIYIYIFSLWKPRSIITTNAKSPMSLDRCPLGIIPEWQLEFAMNRSPSNFYSTWSTGYNCDLIVCFNPNPSWPTPTSMHLRTEIIRTALIAQMKSVDSNLKAAKGELEHALAQDHDLVEPTKKLETANLEFKEHIRHVNMHLPKAKAKAKAKASAVA